jgi:hypothetical protein
MAASRCGMRVASGCALMALKILMKQQNGHRHWARRNSGISLPRPTSAHKAYIKPITLIQTKGAQTLKTWCTQTRMVLAELLMQ